MIVLNDIKQFVVHIKVLKKKSMSIKNLKENKKELLNPTNYP